MRTAIGGSLLLLSLAPESATTSGCDEEKIRVASRLDGATGDGVQRVPICSDDEARSSWQ
jgi:hypothetical protein